MRNRKAKLHTTSLVAPTAGRSMNKLQSRVKTANSKDSLKARFSLKPRLTLNAEICRSRRGDVESAFFKCPLSDIVGSLIVPVGQLNRGAKLKQETRDGWDRTIQPTRHPDVIDLPIIVSARSNWTVQDGLLEVFGVAYVIAGASTLEAQLREDRSAEMSFLAIFGLSPEQERTLRTQLAGRVSTNIVLQQKVDTDTPRLAIKSRWTSLTIESDPFVVPTARGYAPAILVRRENIQHAEHLLVGARSLSEPLEALRKKRNSLVGAAVRIRKTDDTTPTSPYEVDVEL